MKIIKELTILLISILYITVGLNHFIKPNFFLEIVPPIIPFKLEVVFISGFFEIILGILILFKKTRKLASLLIIVLLVSRTRECCYNFASHFFILNHIVNQQKNNMM